LLEHDSIVAMLTRRDANGRGFPADAGVAQNVIGAGWLLQPVLSCVELPR
jgi:hypothetical protein